MFKITYFSGDQHNVKDGQVVEYQTLEEMSEHFREPIKGGKYNGYFVRGECEPMHRKDANIESSDIIVLDGDMGLDKGNAPRPRDVHDALCKLGYNHFIYTSHSHTNEKNKFRVVLRSEVPMVKAQLRATVGSILSGLKSHGVGIYPVNEMWRWSQPWFIPSRDDPEDGLFEYYGWFNGKSCDVKEAHEEFITDSVKGEDGKLIDFSRDWMSHMQGIIDSDMFHPGILSLGWAFAKDGVDESMAVAFIKTLFSSCGQKDERWQSRYDDIPRVVRQGYEKLNTRIDVDDIEVYDEQDEFQSPPRAEIPWPPGLLGRLTQNAYDMALFQYKEVALVSAVGAVAGIVGRKFNVACPYPSGLNVYLTLIMGTGMGKDSIGKFIKSIYYNIISDVNNTSSSFLGKSRYTSYKAVINDLQDARSKVSVFTEAGLLLSSKSGDMSGFTRALLSLYSCSDHMSYSNAEGFSDTDNDVPILRAPSLSIVSEATPETLLQTFRANNAAERGDIARQSIYRISRQKPYANRLVKFGIDDECIEKLKYLAHKCSQVQAEDDPRAHMMGAETPELQDDIYQWMDYAVDMQRKYHHSDQIKSIMWSRAAVKCLKFAGIASVFNHNTAVICKDEWEWAKSLVQYEMDGVEAFFKGGGFGNILEELSFGVVAPTIVKMLQGKYKDPKCFVSKQDKERGFFPLAGVTFSLKKNKQLNDINDSASGRGRSMTGLQKVIQYMVDQELIRKVGDKRAITYAITSEFKIWFMNG
jgi:hypothetical protein